MKWPILEAPPYWDEGLHYWTARHLGTGYGVMSDLWGNPIGTPQYLLFQRPLFYLLFWAPSQAGFEAFRVTHAIAASLLAPLAYAILRAHGASRPAGALTGLAVAVLPSLVTWGNLGLMDSLMAFWVGVMLWARAMRRHALLLAAALAAVWTKETAYAAVVGLLAFEAIAGWIRGSVSFAPLRLDARVSALAWAALLAPWPLVWAVMHDLALPGAENHGSALPVLDRMFATPWLAPVLVLGLLRARSRFFAGFALAAGALLLLLQTAARDVPQWYEVPTAFLALVACGAAADAWWRDGRPAWTRPAPALLCVLLVYLLVMLPNSDARDRLRPLSGDGGNSLAGSWEFEMEIRDADLHAAIAALPLADAPDLYVVDVAPAAMFGPVTEQARHVYWDSSWARQFIEVDVQLAGRRVEDNATWTLLDRGDLPLVSAIEEVYADCIRHQNAGFTVIQGSACAGRAQRLEDAWRERDPRF